jgi:hypothetical protein
VNEEMLWFDAREAATADSKAKTRPILAIANGAKRSYGCRSKMLNDSCSNRECPYAHDEKSLVEAHGELQERLDKSPYNPKRQSEIALVTKTRPAQDDDDGFEDLCCATFGESKPECTFAVTVALPGAEDQTIGAANVLLDTGTTVRNYVSRDFIHQHHSVLQRRLVGSANLRVRLLNGSVVCVYESIVLALRFEGHPNLFSSKFFVLDSLAVDFIVGCHDSIAHFFGHVRGSSHQACREARDPEKVRR